mmetsp:Transcript_21686/g.35764  ORF Transcript_21686/g.35764 Transcript_21686/m.35764 type:complete len:152 (+) Transcript_21686:1447-1902(+)
MLTPGAGALALPKLKALAVDGAVVPKLNDANVTFGTVDGAGLDVAPKEKGAVVICAGAGAGAAVEPNVKPPNEDAAAGVAPRTTPFVAAGALEVGPATSCTLANGLLAVPLPPLDAAGRFARRIFREASVTSSAFCQVPGSPVGSLSSTTS